MPINQDVLLSEAKQYGKLYESIQKSAAQMKKSAKVAFLCHSHKDEELVKGLIVRFEKEGINLYVDWLDSSMPEKTSKVTAQKIQKRIKEASMFLFLATKSSMESVWCPWELGFADASSKQIFILAIQQGLITYGNEYLDLYSQIDIRKAKSGTKEGLVLYDITEKKASWLNDALK